MIMRMLWALVFLVASVSGASAHPHAWVQVRTTLVVNELGQMVALRQHWQFDKMYSAYVTQDLTPGENKHVTEADLNVLAQSNVDNLGEFHYFTFMDDDKGVAQNLQTPTAVHGVLETPLPFHQSQSKPLPFMPQRPADDGLGKRVAMDFTVPLAAPLPLRGKRVVYRIYDPTYYIDMAHAQSAAVTLVREKDGTGIKQCQVKLDEPKVDQAMIFRAAALDRNTTGPADLGINFSEKVTITCPASMP